MKSEVRSARRYAGDLAFVALGSNLGNSTQILRRTIDRLQDLSDQPLHCSSLWQTSPVDCPPGAPPFVNAVAGLVPRADETPLTLLEKLQALEREFGRLPKKVLNEPRPLDLDLITFGPVVMETARLTLPHPRAHLRRFVLSPLVEVAPELVLPLQSHTVRELLDALRSDAAVRRLD